jgi:glycosyltransferase involved in cell wall biosynthesis
MKFIYLTAKKYPSQTADHAYIKEMARSFTSILGKSFLLIVNNSQTEVLTGINVLNLSIPRIMKRTLFYFFYLPYFFITKCRKEKTIFFSNDLNQLSILIFWKKLFHFDYIVCSDWHMLVNNWKDSYVSKNSDYLITTSKKLQRQIFSISHNSRILTIYGGIDLKYFSQTDKKELQEKLREKLKKELGGLNEGDKGNVKLIGYIGGFKTLGMDKGIQTMIESLVFLDKNFRMVFVGGKDNEIKEYVSIAEKMNVSDRAVFIGRKDFREIALYEQAMDALVIPYPDKPHFRNYGFPMKVYEYMASQRPIIYSKLELAEEILSDCGFVFVADDAEDLSKVIKEVCSSDQGTKVSGMVEKAYGKVKGLTWNDKVKKILDFVDFKA